MMESAIVDLRYKDMDFKLLISDGDSEVFANEFWDSRINCGYQGDDPNVFESREDITALGFSLFRRKQRTTIYVTTLCHEDVLASAVGPGPKAREAMSYLETLCEVHIPVLNELIARYRLLTYDYFAYEVSSWDVPIWHVRGGSSGHISVPLFHYAKQQTRPWIFPRLLFPNASQEEKQEKYQLSFITGSELEAYESGLAAPGENDLLDARNLMERGDYSGAVRRTTTAIEALVEAVLRDELGKLHDSATVDRKLEASKTDFLGRLRQWQKLSGVSLSEGLIDTLGETRSLRHEIVHRGRRLSFEERGLAQRLVDSGRWTFNRIERDPIRQKLRETNNGPRSIARPTMAIRYPVNETPTGFRVRSFRSEIEANGS
jgi:hypothetical protein